MIPFIIVKTVKGFAYIRPECVVAINASDADDCMILMTDGVTIAAAEPAEAGGVDGEQIQSVLGERHCRVSIASRAGQPCAASAAARATCGVLLKREISRG